MDIGSVIQQDVAASLALVKEAPFCKPKKCYDNVLHCVTSLDVLTTHPTWRVVYGGMAVEGLDGKAVCHAFFMDTETGLAIDPTVALRQGPKSAPQTYYHALTLDLTGYARLAVEYENMDAHDNPGIKAAMDKLTAKLLDRGIFLLG